MLTTNKQIYFYSGIIATIACVICGYFNWKISLGIAIGVLSSFVYFFVLNLTFKIEDGKMSKGGIFGFFFRIIIIAFPLLVSCLFPQYFNIFGAFGGVMLFRIVMMVMFFKQREDM